VATLKQVIKRVKKKPGRAKTLPGSNDPDSTQSVADLGFRPDLLPDNQ